MGVAQLLIFQNIGEGGGGRCPFAPPPPCSYAPDTNVQSDDILDIFFYSLLKNLFLMAEIIDLLEMILKSDSTSK